MRPDLYYGSYDFSNPQSLNRYAYVGNNPLAFADPIGLFFNGGGGGSSGVAADGECGDTCDSCEEYFELWCSPSWPTNGTTGSGSGSNAPNNGKPETPACRQLRQNAQELQSQVNHPFAWNGPQMTGFKIGAGIAIVGNAVVGCAAGVLLTTAATAGGAAPAAEATCTGGAIANSISPVALASDLLTGGAGFAVAQYLLQDQAQHAWAQYDSACR
jgi:hypothetical protein